MPRELWPASSHKPYGALFANERGADGAFTLRHLQQDAGNQAMQHLLRSGYIQAKSSIGSPDDASEREADQVANNIMRKSAVAPCSCAQGEMCEECRQQQSQPSIARRASAPAAPSHAPRIVSDILRSPGRALDRATRAFFEPRFGRDFGDVRIHTGADASASARSINAHAYTAGFDIVFASGQYAPDTIPGRTLLAHELTHVVQQHRAADLIRRQIGTYEQMLWNDSSDEEPSAESLYDHSFAPYSLAGVDKCADHMAMHLAKHVAAHADPYDYIQTAIHETPDRHEDNVSAAFMALLSEVQLTQFSRTDAGRKVLEIMYDAMITGNVSDFERYQAARIEQFGLAGAVKRQVLPGLFYLDSASPEDLTDRFISGTYAFGFDDAVDWLARQLRKDLDNRPDPYAFIARVFHLLPDSSEDNVAAAFVAMFDNLRLDQIAKTDGGRTLLDILYEAMITGDVSAFERYEASERILKAKNMTTSLADLTEYQQHRRIFPIRYQKFFRDTYAPLSAQLLDDGRIRAYYSTVRVFDDMFKNDVATLHTTVGELTGTGIFLKTDEIVSVRLYDEDETLLDIPAIALLDYANESTNRTLSLAGQAFMAGLTLPLGGLPEAGLARGLAIADRVAWAIYTASALIKDNEEWIAKLPFGKEFLEAVDAVNNLAAYYGWTRMGVDGLRFASSRLRPMWNAWHAELPELSAAHSEAQAIDSQLESTLQDLATAEEAASAGASAGREAPGATPETTAPTASEESVLATTATKGGTELSPDQALTERELSHRDPPEAAADPPFTKKYKLPNGHEIRETPQGDVFERCSVVCGIYNSKGERIGQKEIDTPEPPRAGRRPPEEMADAVEYVSGRQANRGASYEIRGDAAEYQASRRSGFQVYEYRNAEGELLYVGKSGGVLDPDANWVDRLQDSHINTDWISEAVRVRVFYDLTEQEMWALEEVEIPTSVHKDANVKPGEYSSKFPGGDLSANASSALKRPNAVFAIYAIPVR